MFILITPTEIHSIIVNKKNERKENIERNVFILGYTEFIKAPSIREHPSIQLETLYFKVRIFFYELPRVSGGSFLPSWRDEMMFSVYCQTKTKPPMEMLPQ